MTAVPQTALSRIVLKRVAGLGNDWPKLPFRTPQRYSERFVGLWDGEHNSGDSMEHIYTPFQKPAETIRSLVPCQTPWARERQYHVPGFEDLHNASNNNITTNHRAESAPKACPSARFNVPSTTPSTASESGAPDYAVIGEQAFTRWMDRRRVIFHE